MWTHVCRCTILRRVEGHRVPLLDRLQKVREKGDGENKKSFCRTPRFPVGRQSAAAAMCLCTKYMDGVEICSCSLAHVWVVNIPNARWTFLTGAVSHSAGCRMLNPLLIQTSSRPLCSETNVYLRVLVLPSS